MTHFPDQSGSAFTREAFTMAAWLNHVTSLFLSGESASAARRASAYLGSGSNRLIRQSAFLKLGQGKSSRNGNQKLFLTFGHVFRSPTPSLMPSCSCLATISKPFLVEILNTIRGHQILTSARTIYAHEQAIGGLA